MVKSVFVFVAVDFVAFVIDVVCAVLGGENIADMLKELAAEELAVTLPDTLRYRVYTDESKRYAIHFMPVTITANLHKTVRLHKTGLPIVESLNYEDLTGTVEIAGNVKSVKLYSADLDEVRTIAAVNGKAVIDLTGLKRFFSVIVEK